MMMTTEKSNALAERVYREYGGKITSYITRRVANYHDREDLKSCVLLKVRESAGTFDETRGSLSTWVFTITHNAVCNYFRARAREAAFTEVAATACMAADLRDPAEEAEEAEALADALARLDERERAIAVLYYYHGKSLAEIADLLGINYGNAKFLRHRAAAKLKKLLAADDRIKEI